MRLSNVSLAIALAACAHAHDPGLSSSRIDVGDRDARLTLAFAGADVAAALPAVDVDGDGRVSAAELATGRDGLLAFAMRGARLAVGGRPAAVARAEVRLADNGDVCFALGFEFGADLGPAESLLLTLPGFDQLPRGHRHWAAFHGGAGAVLAEGLLHAGAASLSATCLAPPPDALVQLWSFVRLGIEHILIGYDHVLFLLGLLAAGGGLRSAAKVITAFTLAHSLTLAAATLHVVRLPSALVEAVIAASIVYVGIENLWRRRPGRRWPCAFGFGLVHGLGFASVLEGLGITTRGSVIAPLLTFNLGVEIGQMAIAAVAVPMLVWVGRRAGVDRVRAVLSVPVTLAGSWWLVERVLL